MMFQQYQKRPPIYSEKDRDPQNALADTPITGDAAKLDHWRQELASGRQAEHPTRERVERWAIRRFFILLGAALLAFLILFPIFAVN